MKSYQSKERSVVKNNVKKMTIAIIVAMSIFLTSMGVALADHRETIVYLNNNRNAHVPTWDQPRNIGGFKMGCGATAWAIVYGYWKQHKGKIQLFDGNSINTEESSPPVVTATSEIAKHIRTYYHEKFDDGDIKRPGSTRPRNMCDGIKYAQSHGYPHSRCWKITGSEFDKFEHIKRYLENDRPVILNYDTEGHGATNHYGVIEGVKKIEERVGNSWRNRDIWYYINNGHGKQEWISARQVGRNISQIYTVTNIFLITVSENPLPEASDVNEEACKEWCQQNQDKCAMCSSHSGCGPGYESIKAFKEQDKNWYACRKRDTHRAGHSESNRLECEAWCRENPGCVKCSTIYGCGKDYRHLKSWAGQGNNWHACARREPSSRDEASDKHFRECKEWCDSNPDCVHCTTLKGCGPDMKTLKSWTGWGRNWHACSVSDRQLASQENEQACRDFCNVNNCTCSTRRGCGAGKKSIKSWTGRGTNWHACVDR
ncbi:MAG: hypothetical protein AB1480_06260 [Nitrospirota bacterium]